MARPLRIEFPGAIYHVTSRGDRRESIFEDDVDRERFLAVLDQATARFNAQVLAYCLMGNHYHLVLHTRQGNLSLLMRHLNGVYTQAYNRRHGVVGHLFQGRFKAILVDRDAYLLTLCRYVELNPVRAKLCRSAKDWAWSSYRAHAGLAVTPDWLDSDGLHGYLLGHDVRSAQDRQQAAGRYAALVDSSPDLQIWAEGLRQQIFLGDEDFVLHMQALMEAPPCSRQKHSQAATFAHPQAFAGLARGSSLTRRGFVQGAHTRWAVDDGHGTDAGAVGVAGESTDCEV